MNFEGNALNYVLQNDAVEVQVEKKEDILLKIKKKVFLVVLLRTKSFNLFISCSSNLPLNN